MSHKVRRVSDTHRVRYLLSDFRYWWRFHAPSFADHRAALAVVASAMVLIALVGGAVLLVGSLIPSSASTPTAPSPTATTNIPVPVARTTAAPVAPPRASAPPKARAPVAPPPHRPSTSPPPKDVPHDQSERLGPLRPAREH